MRDEAVVISNGDDGYEPRLREGTYAVAFVAEAYVPKLNGRPVWVVRFRVIEGPATGIELKMYLPRMPLGAKPTPGWTFVSAYITATELRPPKHLYRFKPSDFLQDCVFNARVVDVKRDRHHVERPDGARYSRVQVLVKRTAGRPRCLGKRSQT